MNDAARRERARPLAPADRREAIITATRPLLYEHGRDTTTKLIAEAAGIDLADIAVDIYASEAERPAGGEA